MNRRRILSIAAITALVFASLPSSRLRAQQKPLKGQLLGTWMFVASVDVRKDGTRVDRWGPNPKGMLVFDTSGRYVLAIRSFPNLSTGEPRGD
jgi:hypothetical protein